MIKVKTQQFQSFVAQAIDAIPSLYQEHLQNVAFIVEDRPTNDQRKKLKLKDNDLLFGLYEGVPLPGRSGQTKILPDKITIFKNALEAVSINSADLEERIRHTIWHEVAHYYGLDHLQIGKLDSNNLSEKIAQE